MPWEHRHLKVVSFLVPLSNFVVAAIAAAMAMGTTGRTYRTACPGASVKGR
jgi:hypothetical protein